MRAAQELLGAPTIGGGSAWPGDGGGGSQRRQISLPSRLECTKRVEKLVIPVQSFGSHIRPQPPGLGLSPFASYPFMGFTKVIISALLVESTGGQQPL